MPAEVRVNLPRKSASRYVLHAARGGCLVERKDGLQRFQALGSGNRWWGDAAGGIDCGLHKTPIAVVLALGRRHLLDAGSAIQMPFQGASRHQVGSEPAIGTPDANLAVVAVVQIIAGLECSQHSSAEFESH